VRIFSGIQPTGAKHFGNYSGGFRQYVQTQEQGEAFFCIVDLHSITVEHDPQELRKSTLDLAALLFATGLDPDRSTVFVQSHVTAHAEAAWLLSAVSSVGELRRMTQYKDKSRAHEFVSAGLFTYPVLMAGDVLLYQTDLVPIGDDQRQHLELMRDVGARFNARYGETFKLPQGVYPKVGARIMDLQEPDKKMSTSTSSEMGKILIVDPPEAIRKKIMSAVTDTGREVRRAEDKPGITNLVDIMSVASGQRPEEIERRYADAGYGRFKAEVADAVIELLRPIRERHAQLLAEGDELQRLLAEGAERAREISAPTLQAMYDRMGFTRPARAEAGTAGLLAGRAPLEDPTGLDHPGRLGHQPVVDDLRPGLHGQVVDPHLLERQELSGELVGLADRDLGPVPVDQEDHRQVHPGDG
jgi:tryptophanyl-tRNA synthetase